MIIPRTDDSSLPRIGDAIKGGGVIAFRTDTFYGLGADPFNRSAVQRIKDLKGREEHKPILVIISTQDQFTRFISERSPIFDLLAEKFWPGPLTLIGRAADSLPEDLTAGTKTVGVRLPDDDRVRTLVQACGGALTATSANPAHQRPAKTAADVDKYFGDGVDLIIDDGESKTDRPSTVIDATSNRAVLIREGVIAWNEIQAELQAFPISSNVGSSPSGRG